MNCWDVYKIGELCDVITGSTPSRTNSEYWNEGSVPWFTVDDIRKGGRVIHSTIQHVTEKAVKESSLRLMPADTVLLCCTASVGEYAITRVPITSNQQFNGLVIKSEYKDKLSADFLFNVASTLKEKLKAFCGKTSVDFVSGSNLKSIQIPLPPLAEQRKIAEILRTWDESIETAEAELKAKQERKRWLTVSLIFSKGMGAKSKAHKYVPIGNFLREDVDSVDPSQSPDEHFELWSIPAHDKGVADYVKGFQVGSHKKLVNPGDVLISKIVPHIQRSRVVGRSERKCRVIASTEWIVFGGGKIEAEYLREVLISEDFHRKFMETITGVGGSLARANVKAVAKIKIPLPSIQEQRNIADVLLCAGADEGAITQRIESLRAQKRGLMQKLLTGEVRVTA